MLASCCEVCGDTPSTLKGKGSSRSELPSLCSPPALSPSSLARFLVFAADLTLASRFSPPSSTYRSRPLAVGNKANAVPPAPRSACSTSPESGRRSSWRLNPRPGAGVSPDIAVRESRRVTPGTKCSPALLPHWPDQHFSNVDGRGGIECVRNADWSRARPEHRTLER